MSHLPALLLVGAAVLLLAAPCHAADNPIDKWEDGLKALVERRGLDELAEDLTAACMPGLSSDRLGIDEIMVQRNRADYCVDFLQSRTQGITIEAYHEHVEVMRNERVTERKVFRDQLSAFSSLAQLLTLRGTDPSANAKTSKVSGAAAAVMTAMDSFNKLTKRESLESLYETKYGVLTLYMFLTKHMAELSETLSIHIAKLGAERDARFSTKLDASCALIGSVRRSQARTLKTIKQAEKDLTKKLEDKAASLESKSKANEEKIAANADAIDSLESLLDENFSWDASSAAELRHRIGLHERRGDQSAAAAALRFSEALVNLANLRREPSYFLNKEAARGITPAHGRKEPTKARIGGKAMNNIFKNDQLQPQKDL